MGAAFLLVFVALFGFLAFAPLIAEVWERWQR